MSPARRTRPASSTSSVAGSSPLRGGRPFASASPERDLPPPPPKYLAAARQPARNRSPATRSLATSNTSPRVSLPSPPTRACGAWLVALVAPVALVTLVAPLPRRVYPTRGGEVVTCTCRAHQPACATMPRLGLCNQPARVRLSALPTACLPDARWPSRHRCAFCAQCVSRAPCAFCAHRAFCARGAFCAGDSPHCVSI